MLSLLNMIRTLVPLLILTFVAGITLVFGNSKAIAATSLPPGFEETEVAGGFSAPTAMAFAPDGRLFVAEQAGSLRVIKNGSLLQTPFLTVSVVSSNERGLLGLAFHPNFLSNGYVYVYYTSSETGQNRLSQFTASVTAADVAEPGSELVILDNIAGGIGYHNGGAIHFGADGMLYVAVGDAHSSSNAQSLETLAGKLLRVDPSSYPNIIPSDNPFVRVVGAREEIWALGLRNPFTFAVEPNSGRIHINDVGQGTWEEINLGIAGANYGWPVCEGACSSPNPNYQDPIHAYNHEGNQAAITGGAFNTGNNFPAEYSGDYFFADYLRGFIRRLTPTSQVIEFATGIPGPVDLKVGPLGSLYYLSIFNGAVYKISFVGSVNQSPTALPSATPIAGSAPLTVEFSGAGSTDPDDDALTYTWDFGDASPEETGVTVSHTYVADGQFDAVLTVEDGKGGQDSESIRITVGSTATRAPLPYLPPAPRTMRETPFSMKAPPPMRRMES